MRVDEMSLTACNLSVKLFIGAVIILTANAQDTGGSNLTMCIPFPHSHLFCGQYIDASTVVYIDPSVFNYTELNNAIKIADDGAVFGSEYEIDLESCIKQLPYMICQYVYPRCNSTTQTLLPVCVDNCLDYTEMCEYGFNALRGSSFIYPIFEMLVINCTHQFRAFGSVTVDLESCYHLYLAPIFVTTTQLVESAVFRHVVLTNQSTYLPYCSGLISRDVIVRCRATGDPIPTIDIYRENDDGSQHRFDEVYRGDGEVAIGLFPIKSGENIMFHCNASNIVSYLTISVDLTYTCCSGDVDMMYSIGQQFSTAKNCTCNCGEGYSLSCGDHCSSVESEEISAGMIAVIVVIIVALIIATTIVVVLIILWLRKQKNKKQMSTCSSDNPAVNQEKNANGGKIMLNALNVPTHQSYSSHSQETPLDSQNDDNNNSQPGESHSRYITDEEKSPTHKANPPVHSSVLSDILEKDENFKPTPEAITNTMIINHLNSFIKPISSLTIMETLGEGAFGKVFYGKFTDKTDGTVIEVAVKTVKDCHSMEELDLFITESVIMKDFKHRNVLGLVGVSVGVEDEKAIPYIILPYMANGDLKGFLKEKRIRCGKDLDMLFKEINYLILVKMCSDICRGMEYLAIIKFVHRDLAARNCMIDKDLMVKVADFGLSRDIYSNDYYRMGHKAKVPIKWMPPESIHDRYYNQQTDVWSFGVVCWEVFSLGKLPYPAIDPQNVLQYIEKGKRLPKPALCSGEMYQIMLSCWQLKNNDRPTFSKLAEQIEQHYSDVLESDPSNPSSPYLNLLI